MELILLRHAKTAWNLEKRYQGRTDTPLCEEGRKEAVLWKGLPPAPDHLFCSPLRRARETAALLFPARTPVLHDALVEMALGSWEGRVAADLLEEAEVGGWNGLDFALHGGESMRQVMHRLQSWLETLPKEGGGTAVVISHKMVITALYSLATGWDACSKPAERLRFPRIHRFHWDGKLSLISLNEPLEER